MYVSKAIGENVEMPKPVLQRMVYGPHYWVPSSSRINRGWDPLNE